MERTKKILALLLILTMIMCFGMTACGSNGSDGGSTDPAENQQEEAQNEEESATEAPEIKGLTFESELEKDYGAFGAQRMPVLVRIPYSESR